MTAADDPLTMPQDEFDLVRQLADATKPCGCGPLQPCAPHRDTGDLQDWEGRARAAEAKLAALRSVLLEGGQDDATARRRAIAIVGTGEGDHDQ